MRMLRYALTEPRDALAHHIGRLMCRTLRRHGHSCRGRRDHHPHRDH